MPADDLEQLLVVNEAGEEASRVRSMVPFAADPRGCLGRAELEGVVDERGEAEAPAVVGAIIARAEAARG